MNNNHKLIKAFTDTLDISEEIVIDGLEYNSIEEWDSVAHMSLVSSIEDQFGIFLDTDDIIDMSSVAECKKILEKYGIEF